MIIDELKSSVDVWLNTQNTFPFIKGRVALFAILKAAGIGRGDEVLVPGFTCVVVPAAVCYTGATPVFFDIDRNTYNGNPLLAVKAITKQTKAILVQHTFGSPADMCNLHDVC